MTDYPFETICCTGPDEDGVLIATLDRPDRLNALTATMFAELAELCRRVTDDGAVRIVVLTGAGRGFCAGLDLAEAATIPGDERDRDVPGRRRPAPRPSPPSIASASP